MTPSLLEVSGDAGGGGGGSSGGDAGAAGSGEGCGAGVDLACFLGDGCFLGDFLGAVVQGAGGWKVFYLAAQMVWVCCLAAASLALLQLHLPP